MQRNMIAASSATDVSWLMMCYIIPWLCYRVHHAVRNDAICCTIASNRLDTYWILFHTKLWVTLITGYTYKQNFAMIDSLLISVLSLSFYSLLLSHCWVYFRQVNPYHFLLSCFCTSKWMKINQQKSTIFPWKRHCTQLLIDCKSQASMI